MAEAEYCDRIAILDAGRVLAQGRPEEIRARGVSPDTPDPTMDDAFIAVVESARAAGAEPRAA
jgi:ABC-2 type transport system ATP-binding protein